MSYINTIWQAIETWYDKQGAAEVLWPGATEADIARLESELGVQISEDLRVSLLRHNGSADDAWPEGELLSVDQILANTSQLRSNVAAGDFNNDHLGDPQLLPHYWADGWICISRDGAGNSSAVDMTPGDEGTTGQVLDMDHEVGPSYLYRSYGDWLQAQYELLSDAKWTGDYLEIT